MMPAYDIYALGIFLLSVDNLCLIYSSWGTWGQYRGSLIIIQLPHFFRYVAINKYGIELSVSGALGGISTPMLSTCARPQLWYFKQIPIRKGGTWGHLIPELLKKITPPLGGAGWRCLRCPRVPPPLFFLILLWTDEKSGRLGTWEPSKKGTRTEICVFGNSRFYNNA